MSESTNEGLGVHSIRRYWEVPNNENSFMPIEEMSGSDFLFHINRLKEEAADLNRQRESLIAIGIAAGKLPAGTK